MSLLQSVCISTKVIYCEVVETEYWHEDYLRFVPVYGVHIQFSDDQTIDVPDLCTRFEDAKKFAEKIQGEYVCKESIPDIVDDFLSELYG